MSVCIIGKGVAGLCSAIKIKTYCPNMTVTILSSSPTSNSKVAGQRYRERATGQPRDSIQQLISLIEEKNNSSHPHLKFFLEITQQELDFWKKYQTINYTNEAHWFGPQLGSAISNKGGRGKNLMNILEKEAINLGVQIISGAVVSLDIENDENKGIWINYTHHLNQYDGLKYEKYDTYILSGGSVGGRLFESTNVPIRFSPQELLIDNNKKLHNFNTHMFHIFGNSNEDGKIKIGCKETDNLSECEIYLKDEKNHFSILDKDVMNLLRQHKTHDNFMNIAKRFYKHGGLVKIKYPDDKVEYSKVSYHYNHISPSLEDFIRIKGVNNLFAIGDAANLNGFIGNNERLPGFALSNCIVSAELIAKYIRTNFSQTGIIQIENKDTSGILEKLNNDEYVFKHIEKTIKEINTHYLFEMTFGENGKEVNKVSEEWKSKLLEYKERNSQLKENALLKISLLTAESHMMN